jgi:hypothetical protein
MAPRDPSTVPSFADLMAAAAWAPPNLPLFKLAPPATDGTAPPTPGPSMAASDPSNPSDPSLFDLMRSMAWAAPNLPLFKGAPTPADGAALASLPPSGAAQPASMAYRDPWTIPDNGILSGATLGADPSQYGRAFAPAHLPPDAVVSPPSAFIASLPQGGVGGSPLWAPQSLAASVRARSALPLPAVSASYQDGVTQPWWTSVSPGDAFAPAVQNAIDSLRNAIKVLRQGGGSTTSGEDERDSPDCQQEWSDARDQCIDLLTGPNPPRGITGGYSSIEDCARGLVSERCGGNPVTPPRQPRTRPYNPR